MTVSVLIISHHDIGTALTSALAQIIGHTPLTIDKLEIGFDMPVEEAQTLLEEKIEVLDQGDGILMLTDLFGATPCNIASRYQQAGKVSVVSGVNLPMLLKLATNPRQSLEEMAESAESGGKTGIINCQRFVAYLSQNS